MKEEDVAEVIGHRAHVTLLEMHSKCYIDYYEACAQFPLKTWVGLVVNY